jgi:serine/threonine protein kinase
MPDHEDSLGGETLDGEEQQDPAEQSLGDQSTFGDANVDDELFDDGMKLEDLSERYTEEGVLGKGGFGEVVVATDTRLGRKVAIKRIQGKASRSKKAVQRFLTEAKSIAALSHNNIVQIHDYGRSIDGPFLIMECVQGGSLLDKCKAGPIELDEAVNIFGQLCDGLAKAHAAGIVHRDIKPANVLMTEDGIPKLTDFGLAKDDTANTGKTMDGAVIGTLDFMPPEQRQGAEFTDHRSDLWSLAATFYQMVTGEPPRVIDLDSVPPAIRPAIAKSLKSKKEDRFQSALEMREVVQQAAAGLNTVRDLGEGECPSCGTTNPSERKFCRNVDCAASLEVDCLSCKTTMPMWEAVCGDCGTKQGPLVEEAKEVLQRKHDEAEAFLNELKFDDALESSRMVSGENDLRLQQLTSWHEGFSQRLVDIRKTEHERLEELLEEAKTHVENYDYEAARAKLSKVDKRLEDHELENLGSAKSILAIITETLARIKKFSTANETVKEQAVAFLGEFEFDKAIEAANEIETDNHPHLKEYDAWVDEFGQEVQSKRDVAYKQLEEQLSQALEHEENFDYEAGLQTLTKVDESLIQTTVSGGEDTAERLTERLTTKQSRLKELDGIVRERVTKEQITGLLPIVNELLILKPVRPAVQNLKEQLEKRDADLLESRDAAVKRATHQLAEQQYAQAVATLNTVSGEVSSEQVEDLKTKAGDLLDQLNNLRDIILTAAKMFQFNRLLQVVEECLDLKADQDDLVKLKQDLIVHEANMVARNQQIISQAHAHLQQLQFDAVVQTLGTLAPEYQTSKTVELRQQVHQLSAQRQSLLIEVPEALSNKRYKEAIKNISNYLSEVAEVDIQDPQLQQMLDEAKGKESVSIWKKKLVMIGIATACVVVLITGVVMKMDREGLTLEDVKYYVGDW